MEMNLNPIDQLDPVVIVGTIVIFSITFLLFRRWFVLPYLSVLETRQGLLDESHALDESAADEVSRAETEAQLLVTDAREKADATMKAAAEETEAYRKETLASASGLASDRLEKGRAEIAAARERERSLMRDHAVECVGLACEKLLGTVDRETAEAYVDRLMARRSE